MKCEQCQAEFIPKLSSQKFCSILCRSRAARQRRGDKIREYQREYHKQYYKEKISAKRDEEK
jgi:hypothetical protein